MIVAFACVFAFVSAVSGKTYERCELARELKYAHGAPDNQVATWVCIARHESEYNTSAVGSKNGDGSSDHGIFQISDKFWCSPPGKGWACGLTCAMLEDDDIADDFVCANKIYKEHKHLQGDGFKAWTVYESFCKGPKVQQYIEGCFTANDVATPHPKKKPTTKKVYPWLVPQSSAEESSPPPPRAPSTCSNRVDVPTKVSPTSTHIPSLTASRFSNNIPTTRQHISVAPVSPQSIPSFPTSSNRLGSSQTPAERKFAFSTPSLTQEAKPQHGQKRESVFVINGRSWL